MVKAVTLKEYVERHEIAVVQCSYCGKRLNGDKAIWLGCYPLCSDCYMNFRAVLRILQHPIRLASVLF